MEPAANQSNWGGFFKQYETGDGSTFKVVIQN